VSLYPAASSSPGLLDRRRCLPCQQVGLARPLLLGQLEEGLLEKVLLAADVLGDGVGAVVATAEPRPLLGAQAAAAVATVRVGTFPDNDNNNNNNNTQPIT